MSIDSSLTGLKSAKEDIRTAIQNKLSGHVPVSEHLVNYPDYVDNISLASFINEDFPPMVEFIDYDGTVLYSYTIDEAAALTELPDLPSHDGLICQGWNWSLEDLQALGREMVVGAMYCTDDDTTRLYMTLENDKELTVRLYLYESDINGYVIDWGDDQAQETLDYEGYGSISHIYAATGDYVIQIRQEAGGTLKFGVEGEGDDAGSLLGLFDADAIVTSSDGYGHFAPLRKVELASWVTEISVSAFEICRCLETITVPHGVTAIGAYAFYGCYSLKGAVIPDTVETIESHAFRLCKDMSAVSIPNGIATISDYAFSALYNIVNISVPDSVTEIGKNAFHYCVALRRLTIPSGVTSIGTSAFYYCYRLAEIVIPESVTEINGHTFDYCMSLSRGICQEFCVNFFKFLVSV